MTKKREYIIRLPRLKQLADPIAFSSLILLILTPDANAYIDPSSGSYFLQIILAGLLGALFALKIYWKRVKSFFTGKDEDSEQSK
ncbi:MAG: hypothetical protein JSV44_11625 [Candidatus Zixiibacteriota bacterium]|nr:MAG: hypothetical protein JSV44_11625 [candidate division Zixibacteria bacterium]